MNEGEHSEAGDPIEALIFEILESEDPEASLDRVCIEHPQLEDEVRRGWAIAGRLLVSRIGDRICETEAGSRLGPFYLLRRLGVGGMGTIYLARHEGMNRHVALKLIRRELLGDERSQKRFHREILAVSRLDHPNICTVYEAGESEGVPWYAMQYVEGLSMAEAIKRAKESRTPLTEFPITKQGDSSDSGRRSGLRQICLQFEKIARALHFAHEQGLIHRDIKPANLMIRSDGEPVVLDFGLAWIEDQEDGQALTMSEERLGTPAYMPPERIRRPGRAPNIRSDIYSLGVTMYECLTLRCPFEAATPDQLYRLILEAPPTRPERVNPAIPRDLSLIVLTAMEKDPDRRYQSCLDLAKDLARFQNRQPIVARPVPPHLRLGRWIQRNTVAFSFTILLLAGLISALYLLGLTRNALEQTQAIGLASASGEVLDHDPMLALLLAREAVKHERRLETVSSLHRALARAHEIRAIQAHEGILMALTPSPDGKWLLTASGGGRSENAMDTSARLWNQEGELIAMLSGHEDGILDARFSPDGQHVATASMDGTVRVWNLKGTELVVLRGHLRPVMRIAWSPDGERILSCSADHTARIWQWREKTSCWLLGHEARVRDGLFDPKGDRVLTCSGDRTLAIWDLDGKRLDSVRVSGKEPYIELLASPTEDRLLALDWGGKGVSILTWDGQPVKRIDGDGSWCLNMSWSLDGKKFVIGCADNRARVFDEEGALLATLRGHAGKIRASAFLGRQELVVTASDDATVRIWDLGGRERVRFDGEESAIIRLAVPSDGRRIISGGREGAVRFWRIDPGDQHIDITACVGVTKAGYCDGRDRVFHFGDGSAAIRRDGAGETRLFETPGVTAVAYARKKQSVFCLCGDGVLREADLQGNFLAEHGKFPAGSLCLAVSADGSRMAAGTKIGTHDLWVRSRGDKTWRMLFLTSPLKTFSLVEGRDTVLVATYSGVHEYSMSEKHLRAFGDRASTYNTAVASPGGDTFFACTDEGEARLFDFDGKVLAEFKGHESQIFGADFAPDGSRLATASQDGTVRLWALDGECLAILRGHQGIVLSVAFSPDGEELLSASADGCLRRWIVDEEALVARARRISWRGLRDSERDRYATFFDSVPPTEGAPTSDAQRAPVIEVATSASALEKTRIRKEMRERWNEQGIQGAYVLSALRRPGSTQEGGLFLVDPRHPGVAVPIEGLPEALRGRPGDEQSGSTRILWHPQEQVLIAGMCASADQEIGLYVLDLDGCRVRRSRYLPLGVSNNTTTAFVHDLALLPDGQVLVSAGPFKSGAMKDSTLALLSVHDLGLQPLLHRCKDGKIHSWEGMASAKDGSTLYLAARRGSDTSGRIWKLTPEAGAVAEPLVTLPGIISGLAIDPKTGHLLVARTARWAPPLISLDLESGPDLPRRWIHGPKGIWLGNLSSMYVGQEDGATLVTTGDINGLTQWAIWLDGDGKLVSSGSHFSVSHAIPMGVARINAKE